MNSLFGFRFYSFAVSTAIVAYFINVLISLFVAGGSLIIGLFAGFDLVTVSAICIFGCLVIWQTIQMVTTTPRLVESKWRIWTSVVSHGLLIYFSGKTISAFAGEQISDSSVWPFIIGLIIMFAMNVVMFIFHILLLSPKQQERFREFEYMSKRPRRFA